MIFNCPIKGLKRILTFTILTFVLVFALHTASYGQDEREETPPLRERIFVGGSFGLQLGTITDIQVSPILGLWVLPRVAIAIGPEYRYYRIPYYKTNVYGGKVYTELTVIKNINSVIPVGVNTGIFLHLEDELFSLENSFWKDQTLKGRFYLNTVLAGAGLSQQVGRRAYLNFMILWALNDSGYGVYSNPEIRVSFNF